MTIKTIFLLIYSYHFFSFIFISSLALSPVILKKLTVIFMINFSKLRSLQGEILNPDSALKKND
ncbi:MAG: hypothetical protein A2X02_07405 [Bacteroidetes bacterium GWF2_29_10]|nr:MAG: hypothetical protein A2X02_07405 [Bacteroidetes bacterium GWF2_29_10]